MYSIIITDWRAKVYKLYSIIIIDLRASYTNSTYYRY